MASWHLDLTLSASRTVRVKFLLLISFPICGLLIVTVAQRDRDFTHTFFTPSLLAQKVNNQGPLSHTIHQCFVLSFSY